MILNVKAGGKAYEVLIEEGALRRAGTFFDLKRRVLVITDSGVPEAYAETIRDQADEGYILTVPEGEDSKSLESVERILTELLLQGFTREDAIVSVGGGMCGDLAGFAASIFMRGIDFLNVPTTLLSMADASLGGKTAVNLLGVKNAAGSFYQPSGVLIDPVLLRTLPKRQISAGLAEILKAALIGDAELFEMIEQAEDPGADLRLYIERALRVKQRFIEADPYDRGLRKALNLGHTLGHGIESAEKGRLLHGEAVALGMIPMCDSLVRERLIPILQRAALPTETDLAPEKIMRYVTHDKKKQGLFYSTVHVEEIGSFVLREMRERSLYRALETIRRES